MLIPPLIIFSTYAILSLLTLIVFTHRWVFPPFNRRHRRNILYSRKLLKKLQGFQPGPMILYLRKIDPFLFEELLLTSYETRGHKIIRNKRYTGDGGSDGVVFIDKQKFHIQAKRYKNAINNKHVAELARLVDNDPKAVGGLFIHTGKTGGKSWDQVRTNKSIKIISGDRLFKLIVQNQ